MELHCWGISHKSTSLEVREKFAFNKKEIDEVLTNLKMTNTFDNGILLSTCNRTELYLIGKKNICKEVLNEVLKILEIEDLSKENFYFLSGHDALVHMCKVASGIDSQVLGEQEIFGQFKLAYKNAEKMTNTCMLVLMHLNTH